jgi:hypothetical protein
MPIPAGSRCPADKLDGTPNLLDAAPPATKQRARASAPIAWAGQVWTFAAHATRTTRTTAISKCEPRVI